MGYKRTKAQKKHHVECPVMANNLHEHLDLPMDSDLVAKKIHPSPLSITSRGQRFTKKQIAKHVNLSVIRLPRSLLLMSIMYNL